MANLTETSEFTPGIYQLETTDDVVGGAEGISNLQAKQLANRTVWLKEQGDENAAAIALLQSQGLKLGAFENGTTTINATALGKVLSYDTDGGAVTATLPACSAPNVGRTLVLQHNENGGLFTANGLTVQRAGSNLIGYNGVTATSLTLDAGDILILSMSSATAWTVVAWHRRSALLPAGAVMPFANNAAPLGWLRCNGQTVSRTQYARLFAAIGTTYGAGNGTTTFNLPDLRAEFIRGLDDSRGIDPGRAIGSAQRGTLTPIDPDGAQNAYVAQYQSQALPGNDGPLAASRVGADLDTNGATNYPNVTTAWQLTTNLSNFLYGVMRPRNVAMLYCIKY